MRDRGLLHKTKFQVLVILVLCIQLIGPQQLLPISSVKSEELTETSNEVTETTEEITDTSNTEISLEMANTEPMITIITPETGGIINDRKLTLTGTALDFPTGTPINLYVDGDPVGTPIEVIENTWTLQIILSEGSHTVLAKTEVEGSTITSNSIVITIDTTLPNIEFENLTNGDYLNSKFCEGITEPLATVKICMDCIIGSEEKVLGKWVDVQADNSGKWMYEDPELAEGSHTLYANAIDQAGNIGTITKRTFILDTLRPQVLPNIFPKQDMTQVPLNTTIQVLISDSTELDEVVINNSINVTQDGKKVDGTINFNRETKELTFTPSKDLVAGKKYNVFISPLGIIDSAKNNAFPRFWSFTTVGIASEAHQNPHGSYSTNVDTCGNCHSTHNAKDSNLLTTKTAAGSNNNESLSADSFCMTCHDGTVVAPLPEKSQTAHTHNAAVKIDGKPSGSSCASCHNPHLEWSEDNPNMAQDHITYQHLPPDPVDPKKPTEEISSKEQLCESCHENDSGEKIANEHVEYRVFKYGKSSTATGIYEDYNLCLRCHNGDFKTKYNKGADISSHYNNLTEDIKKQFEVENGQSSFADREISTEEKEFSGHIIKALDGSPLAGHLPCAECHDTHGSNNIKQLKESLGHEDIQSFTAEESDSRPVKVLIDKKELDFSILTDTKEREFCLSCHNGTTAIYGVTGQKYNVERNEHKANSNKSCSYCHGRGDSEVEKALSAAHAPKKGQVPTL